MIKLITFGDLFPPLTMTLKSLRSDDGNENVKKAVGLD